MKDQYLLEIKDMRVSYRICGSRGEGKREVLCGVDLTVEKGRLAALLGLNGSGKTTLLKAACGLIPMSGGQRMVCGRDMAGAGEQESAAFLSYVPQKHSIIYPIKTLDVVLMGLTPALRWYQTPSGKQRKLAEGLLASLGILEKSEEDFLTLSEGQKQLVLIARALIRNTPVLLFDEPDSALDYENKKMIFKAIRKAMEERNCGGLLALHDPDYALRYCDKILLLKNGKIQGTIECRGTERGEAEQRLRLLYPEIELLSYKGRFLTVK